MVMEQNDINEQKEARLLCNLPLGQLKY